MRLKKSATRGTGPGRREYKTVQFELEKYDEEQGIVSGYASVFGNVDDGGDVVEPGAFAGRNGYPRKRHEYPVGA